MLEHGESGGREFLSQLDRARVVSRCPCGCASVDFEVEGLSPPTGGLRILGDFVFGGDSDLAGAFVFERNGVLAGLESMVSLATLPKLFRRRPPCVRSRLNVVDENAGALAA
jgi:hypothetical protein